MFRSLLVPFVLASFILSTFNLALPVRAQSWLEFNPALPKVTVPTPTGVPYGVPQSVPQPPGTLPASLTNPAGATSWSAPLVAPARNWKLGVYVRNLDVGALVQQVDGGSAAQLAGINVNDVIIAVSGSRIGEFDGRVVDIGDELRKNADALGRVSMVILDARTRSLRNIAVTLTATSGLTSGSATLADRASLPSGSVMTVQLQNASKPFFEVAGGKAVIRAEGTGPFPFALNYDPRYIDPRDQYQLMAYITWNNQVIYSLRQPIPIAASGLNQTFNLSLDRGNFTASAASVSSLAGIPNPPAGTISAASPGYGNLPGAADTTGLNQLFQSILGRPATSAEILAWQNYLQQGNSINDVAIKLMSSPQFRERFPTDTSYVQQIFQNVTGRAPTPAESEAWVARLESVGSPERIIAEMLAQKK